MQQQSYSQDQNNDDCDVSSWVLIAIVESCPHMMTLLDWTTSVFLIPTNISTLHQSAIGVGTPWANLLISLIDDTSILAFRRNAYAFN